MEMYEILRKRIRFFYNAREIMEAHCRCITNESHTEREKCVGGGGGLGRDMPVQFTIIHNLVACLSVCVDSLLLPN